MQSNGCFFPFYSVNPQSPVVKGEWPKRLPLYLCFGGPEANAGVAAKFCMPFPASIPYNPDGRNWPMFDMSSGGEARVTSCYADFVHIMFCDVKISFKAGTHGFSPIGVE